MPAGAQEGAADSKWPNRLDLRGMDVWRGEAVRLGKAIRETTAAAPKGDGWVAFRGNGGNGGVA